MKFATAALLVLLTACSSGSLPSQAQPLATTSPVGVSTIAIPIRATLAPLLPILEAQVPRTFRDTADQSGFTVSYSVARDPIALNVIGTGIHAATTAHYSLQVCRGKLPCVSCGIGETARRAEIALHTHVQWDASWRLRSTTTAQPVHFPDRCAISFLNFDITERFIAPVVDAQLKGAAKVIDQNTPAVTNVKPTAQEVWAGLQAPYEVAPRTWLLFEPVDVALAPLRGEGLNVTTTLTVHARARLLVGDKPVVTPTQLPSLATSDTPPGVAIPFDISLPYAEAARLANERYAHRTYKAGGAPLTISGLRIAPAPGGRIAVEADIDYRGGALKRYNGPVHLEGTPQVDPASNSVVVPDLDYTLDTAHRNVFVRTAERFAHDAVRQSLRESATYPLSSQTTQLRDEITKSLARQLAPGVTLQGRVDAIQPELVIPAADAIHVRVVVKGAAEVRVTK